MNDKIKVWKCATCIEKEPCIVGSVDSESELTTETKQCILKGAISNKPNWQPSDEYQIVKKEPTKPQPARYRLEIQYPIAEKHVTLAYVLTNYIKPSEITPKFAHSVVGIGTFTFNDIPESWLIPIVEDEQVVSAEDFVEWNCSANNGIFKPWENDERFKSVMKTSFVSGEKNNELRHREKTSQNEWYKTYDYVDKTAAVIALDAWQACLKSRGFDE